MRPSISVIAKGREFVVDSDPTTGKYMFPQELVDVADRFWEVDGLYYAGFFAYCIDYFRVLAIGEEKVFGERYIVHARGSVWNWARRLVGLKPKTTKVTVEVYIVDQNKYFFGRTKVDTIKETSLCGDVTYEYQQLQYILNRDPNCPPRSYWVVGGTYKSKSLADDRTFEILYIHMNQLFVRFDDGSEGVKELGSWITRVK
jgi:hypothetical protein